VAYRGPLAVHAWAREPERADVNGWLSRPSNASGWELWPPGTHNEFEGFQDRCHLMVGLPRGAVVATVELVDILSAAEVNWAEADEPYTETVRGGADSVYREYLPRSQQSFVEQWPAIWYWVVRGAVALDPPRPVPGRGGLWEWDGP
jgi:hypothetical protein